MLAIPMTVVSRPADSIRLMFCGLTDAIEIIVAGHEIAVSVAYEGKCRALLVDFECGPGSGGERHRVRALQSC